MTIVLHPSLTACLTYPNADHSECPSSVECFHAVDPSLHLPSNDDDCRMGACGHSSLPGEKDTMEAYVADRAPHMAPFVFFPRSETVGYHALYRIPFMAGFFPVEDIAKCLKGEHCTEDDCCTTMCCTCGEPSLRALLTEIEAELPRMEAALQEALGEDYRAW